MLKKERDYVSGSGVNSLELDWWNNNAEIVSKVWEMNDDISWTARKRYLNRAKVFFEQGNDKNVILEIGCGSGWVGQFIAGPNLQIIGTDFSESQINLAKKKAKEKGLDKYCEYFVADSAVWPHKTEKVDGVLIHSFLHHLSGKEIKDFFRDLKRNLRKGTKVWIYEPTFYLAPKTDHSNLSILSKFLLKITHCSVNILGQIYSQFNLLDKTTKETFITLTKQASDKGWYLSPKEVPFDIDDFSKQLAKDFDIKNKYWATVYLIGWLFDSNLLKNNALRKAINKWLLSSFAFIDYLLTKEKSYLEQNIVCPAHAFHVWECILK